MVVSGLFILEICILQFWEMLFCVFFDGFLPYFLFLMDHLLFYYLVVAFFFFQEFFLVLMLFLILRHPILVPWIQFLIIGYLFSTLYYLYFLLSLYVYILVSVILESCLTTRDPTEE